MKRLGEVKALLLALAITGGVFLFLAGLSRALARSWILVAETIPPNVASEILSKGSRLYVANCAACHGYDGLGAEYGPSLHKLHAGDPLLRLVIAGGVGREMPAFGKRFNDAEINSLIAYLRSWKN